MKISVLTATYNRAKFLPNLFQSLIENKKHNVSFEWLIMDDGSTDNTKQVVEEFIQQQEFPIHYYYQSNQGKMKATNQLVSLATGNVMVDCDSDDCFTKDAFSIISEKYVYFEKDISLYALAFLKYEKENTKQYSGTPFPQEEKTKMFDLYYKQGVEGEKILVFNANIRKQYQYELEQKEKFVTEARLYHKMDQKYSIYCFNQAIEIGSYEPDGYTKNTDKLFLENPYGFYAFFKELLQFDFKGVLFSKRMYVVKHYILFSYLAKQRFMIKFIQDPFNKLLVFTLYLPGKMRSKIRYKKREETKDIVKKIVKLSVFLLV